MKRYVAMLLAMVWLLSTVPMVSADGYYNDDEFNWGEYACTHSTTKTVEAVASTCTTAGHATYQRCTACGVVTDGSDAALPLAEHEYVPLSAEPPTCTEDGFERYYCVNCGDSYTEVIRAEGHSYNTEEIFPDCENSGYVIHTCTVCGDSYVDGRVDALGHNYVLTENVAPTCVATGKKVYVCATCGDDYTEVVAATGSHDYDHGCDEKCNVCGYVRDDAHEYIYHAGAEPTCGEPGYDIYKCWGLFCGNPYVYVEIPATGNHTYTSECDVVCNVCKQERETVVSHNYTLTDSVDVTCTTDGSRTYTCSDCGDTYTDVETAPGHRYNIVITDPDCENGGYTTHTCTACGHSIVDNRVDALGHRYVSKETIPPTCGAVGEMTYTCSVCGDSYTEEIAATGDHEYFNDCESVCIHCYEETREASHNVIHVEAKNATCINMGNIEYWYCDACGAAWLDADCTRNTNLRAVVLPMAENHVYDDDGDATCNLCGYERLVAVAGDANGDGDITNRDLALLQQLINGWGVSVDETVMDVNDDGSVDNRDLALLQQFINGWDVILK